MITYRLLVLESAKLEHNLKQIFLPLELMMGLHHFMLLQYGDPQTVYRYCWLMEETLS